MQFSPNNYPPCVPIVQPKFFICAFIIFFLSFCPVIRTTKDVLAVIENDDKESWLVGAPTTFKHVQKMTRWKKYNRFTWKNWFGQPIVGLHWTHSTVHWISHSRERGRTFCKRKRGRQRERGNWTETQRVLERRSERQIVRLRGCVCERERHRET